MWEQIALGTASGFAADEVRRRIHPEDETDGAIAHLRAITTVLHEVKTVLHELSKQSRTFFIQLTSGQNAKYTVTDLPYNAVFVTAPVDVVFSLTGMGNITIALQAGWNSINFPPSTFLTLPDTSTANATLFVKESRFPMAAWPVFGGESNSGYVPLVSPPTQTNAGSDTVLTFTQTVNVVTIQNGSGATLYYAFDKVASLGSLYLLPNGSVIETKRVGVLHLFTAAACNINGATATNIIVTGEL